METPRESHNLTQMRKMIRAVGEHFGCPVDEDTIGNLVIHKPASPSCPDAPTIVVQCHMDMVCTANTDVSHNFATDPISGRIVGDWLMAEGTSLGADDGVGVAACLALLEDSTCRHGPLELLFTVDEETTMGGAANIDGPPFLTGKHMVNVDSEEEYSICIGCAGGGESHMTLPVVREALRDPHVFYRVGISGLLGGHSGCDIHLSRANAIQLVTRLLRATRHTEFFLVNLQGGSGPSALPREAMAEVAILPSNVACFLEEVNTTFKRIQREYAAVEQREGESVLQLSVVQVDDGKVQQPCDRASTEKVIDVLSIIPHGVLRMSPDVEGLVETSISLGIATLSDDKLFLHQFFRSSDDHHTQLTFEMLQSLGRLTGAKIEGPFNSFPGWQPNPHSSVLSIVKEAHKEVMGKEARIYAIHAGLECGFFQQKYPLMECASIGPEVQNPHSPDERVLIASVSRFYALLTRALAKLADMKEQCFLCDR
eukprot:TRINITY_DN19341_c0_g3_i1.p1 TRINITY_DN19341_c0_g3~~TRINITY_DN19341_c0_g3_i1.p1  ORF type:complete len:518 (+),score=103.87 TRINITY_DN19341_c0_g3_i1:103-1554(+)